MYIGRAMDVQQLASRMGDVATHDAAVALREILIERKFEGKDTAHIPPIQWELMVMDAVDRAEETA